MTGGQGEGRHVGFDHVTFAVRDLDDAKGFFALLGFEETASTVVTGEVMSAYMGIPEWKADHVTLTRTRSPSHQEVQLLRFHEPQLVPRRDERDLARLGFNHVCFAVDDLEATISILEANGVRLRSQVMDFHDRRLVLLVGPEDVTIELAEWTKERSA